VKVLCLNVLNGGGNRWGSILKLVDGHDPDIAVFTEWRRSAPGPAEAWAAARGMQWASASDGATRNGVAMAAKPPFDGVSATPGLESAGTLLRATFDGWTMLACYFPQGKAKNRYFDACRDVMQACSGQSTLMIGDLNTGNQVADKMPEGLKYACAERFDRLSSSESLIDLWRLTNGANAREWTWWSRGLRKNGFRIDHAFANEAFVRTYQPACRYDHAPRESKCSDHSALLVSMT
jgi:exodeoxyribonuclease III